MRLGRGFYISKLLKKAHCVIPDSPGNGAATRYLIGKAPVSVVRVGAFQSLRGSNPVSINQKPWIPAFAGRTAFQAKGMFFDILLGYQ